MWLSFFGLGCFPILFNIFLLVFDPEFSFNSLSRIRCVSYVANILQQKTGCASQFHQNIHLWAITIIKISHSIICCYLDNSCPPPQKKDFFGHRFQIKALNDSFGFCVRPCRHFCKREGRLKSLKMGLIFSMTASGNGCENGLFSILAFL